MSRMRSNKGVYVLEQFHLDLLLLSRILHLLHSLGQHLDLVVAVLVQEGVVLREYPLVQLPAHVRKPVSGKGGKQLK